MPDIGRPRVLLLILVSLSLSGCGAAAGSGGEPDRPEEPASAAPSPGATLRSAPTRRPTLSPVPCVNNAKFIEDLTIPDGSAVDPGSEIDKRWSVQNTGTCDWGQDYRLLRLDDSELGGAEEMALYPARAGSVAVLRVEVRAPNLPGTYQARWQARAPNGELFGDVVYVLVVVETAISTPTVGLTSTP